MRKINTLIASTATFLTSAPFAFADTSVTTCPSGDFGKLCATNATDIAVILPRLIQIVFVVAVLIALAFLIFGGVRWILSGGEKEKVGEARNMIVAAIVGLVVVFLAYFILNIVLGLFGLSLSSLSLPTIIGK